MTARRNEPKKLDHVPVRRDLAAVDLFCGAGGLTCGLRSAGIDVVAGFDFDPNCQYPYETNNKGSKFFRRDVAKLTAREVADCLGTAKVRVLAGCAPCQPFSSYSQRYETRGTERWKLLEHFARLVKAIVPDIVTMENVPTVTKHEVFHEFVRTLERLDYSVWHAVVDGADHGLPQRRRRTVLLASRHGPIRLIERARSSPKSVRQAIGTLRSIPHGGKDPSDPLHVASRLSTLNLQRIRASRPGGSWRDWPDHLVAKCHRKKTGHSYPGVYGRMTWDDPAPTLTTQFFGFGSGRFGHPTQDRGLSLREGAILQGFPNGYAFVPDGSPIGLRALGRLIGNAVPVTLGRVIGESIVHHVDSVIAAD